jgi:hypothetical protein
MQKQLMALSTATALILSFGAVSASAQQSPGSPMMQQSEQQQTQREGADQDEPGMMGRDVMGRGMMGRGMMGRGMMGHRGMMAPFVMRIIFALMDADGDGTISLQEWQAAHERLFKAMDTDHDGTVSLEEMEAFIHGSKKSTPQR